MKIYLNEIGPNENGNCVIIGGAILGETSCGFSVTYAVNDRKLIGETSVYPSSFKRKTQLKKLILAELFKEPPKNFE